MTSAPGLSHVKLGLARPERFELPTPRFVVWCSIQLSYGRLGWLKAAKATSRKPAGPLTAFAQAGKSKTRAPMAAGRRPSRLVLRGARPRIALAGKLRDAQQRALGASGIVN